MNERPADRQAAGSASDRSVLPGRVEWVTPSTVTGAALATTGIHVVSTGLGLIEQPATLAISVIVNVGFFALGTVLFVVAFLIAAGRSRTEDLWFGGVFFLTGGVAPERDRRILLGCVAVQSIVGLIGASLAPFTTAAFAVLVPLLGLAFVAFYGARFGRFSPKPDDR